MMDLLYPIPDYPSPGTRWRHFKGTEYEIVTLARDCADPFKILVIYKDDAGHVWVRERLNFLSFLPGNRARFGQL